MVKLDKYIKHQRMKHYHCLFSWTFIVILSFSFIACSHDDDDETDLLIGVWVSEEPLPMYEDGRTTSEVIGSVKAFFQFMEDGSLIEKDVITMFKSGKTYTETSTYGRWTAKGNRLIITTSFAEYSDPKENPDVTECTYKFENGKLMLTYQDEETGKVMTISFVRSQMPKE